MKRTQYNEEEPVFDPIMAEIDNMNEEELNTFIKELEEDLEPDFNIEKINSHKYRFTIKNLIYHVEITESVVLQTNKRILEIKFKLMNTPNAPKRSNFQTDQQYNIALQKSQVGITGTGNVRPVLKKVIGAIIGALREFNPNYVTFTADEESRKSLYGKMIDIVQKYIPFQYKRLDRNPLTSEELEKGEFWLEIMQNNENTKT